MYSTRSTNIKKILSIRIFCQGGFSIFFTAKSRWFNEVTPSPMNVDTPILFIIEGDSQKFCRIILPYLASANCDRNWEIRYNNEYGAFYSFQFKVIKMLIHISLRHLLKQHTQSVLYPFLQYSQAKFPNEQAETSVL